jgi:hypothetical protein
VNNMAKCTVCGKNMPGNILPKHMVKQHPVQGGVDLEPKKDEVPTTTQPVESVKPVEQVTPEAQPVQTVNEQGQPTVETPKPVEQPVVPETPKENLEVPAENQTPGMEVPTEENKDTRMVVLKSADNRPLEVSINNQTWTGKEISVPKDQADTVRRELLRGGFFLKD